MARAASPVPLVVEDDPNVAALFREILEEEHWSVFAAATLTAARRLLRQLVRGPDLVVLDQELPDGRGLSLVLAIRRSHPKARAVVVTAARALTRELEGNLVDAVFHKPFELKRFLAEAEAAAHAPA